MTIEVYTQVHRQASHYDPQRGTPSAWLLTLTRSRAIDRLRIETLRRAREESLDETATIASLLGDPEACSASSELRRIVQHALSRLTPEQREAIEIAYYAWALARVLITFLLDHMVPAGAVLLAGDDTVTEHPGPHVFGKGRHCDGVRSTHSYAAYRWGHKWVVVSVLVKLPLATRPWALPVLVAFHPPEWDRVHGTRHKTPAHMARLLLARLVRWFPEGHFIFVGDTDYSTRWQQWFFQIPRESTTFSKPPRSLQETILYALAPAA